MSKPLTILFIDDDNEDLAIFCEAMGIIDPAIQRITSSNGQEALNLLQQQEAFVPDYIFLDINMPVMNGKECLPYLKQMDKLKEVPVIMCSTSNYTADQEVCEQLGADFYLVKPDTLIKTISSFQYIFELYEGKKAQALSSATP